MFTIWSATYSRQPSSLTWLIWFSTLEGGFVYGGDVQGRRDGGAVEGRTSMGDEEEDVAGRRDGGAVEGRTPKTGETKNRSGEIIRTLLVPCEPCSRSHGASRSRSAGDPIGHSGINKEGQVSHLFGISMRPGGRSFKYSAGSPKNTQPNGPPRSPGARRSWVGAGLRMHDQGECTGR